MNGDAADALHTFFKDHLRLSPPVLPPNLYHYTDAAGMKGIIESNSLWLTDAEFSNDSAEGRHGWLVLRQDARDVFGGPDVNHSSELERLIRRCTDTHRTENSTFIACFSTVPDLLSQWRGYGANGAGYCIEFQAAELPRRNQLFQVQYNDADKHESIRALLQDLQASVSAISDPLFELDDELEDVDMAASILFTPLAQQAVAFKNSGFAEEGEWRYAVVLPDSDGEHERTQIVHFHERRGHIVPYLQLHFGGLAPIRRIILGPTRSTDADTRALRLLLRRNGHDPALVRIERSTCSYRGH